MSTPLRESRDLRRVAPLSKGGKHDHDIAAERAAKPAGAAAYRRATWAAIDARNPAKPAIAIGTFDESTLFTANGGAQATGVANLPPPRTGDWRNDLAAQLVHERQRRRVPLTRERAIERLEWKLEEVAERGALRITRQHLVTLYKSLPITIEDATFLCSGGMRIDQVIDRCFQLLGDVAGHDSERVLARDA